MEGGLKAEPNLKKQRQAVDKLAHFFYFFFMWNFNYWRIKCHNTSPDLWCGQCSSVTDLVRSEMSKKVGYRGTFASKKMYLPISIVLAWAGTTWAAEPNCCKPPAADDSCKPPADEPPAAEEKRVDDCCWPNLAAPVWPVVNLPAARTPAAWPLLTWPLLLPLPPKVPKREFREAAAPEDNVRLPKLLAVDDVARLPKVPAASDEVRLPKPAAVDDLPNWLPLPKRLSCESKRDSPDPDCPAPKLKGTINRFHFFFASLE